MFIARKRAKHRAPKPLPPNPAVETPPSSPPPGKWENRSLPVPGCRARSTSELTEPERQDSKFLLMYQGEPLQLYHLIDLDLQPQEWMSLLQLLDKAQEEVMANLWLRGMGALN